MMQCPCPRIKLGLLDPELSVLMVRLLCRLEIRHPVILADTGILKGGHLNKKDKGAHGKF